VPELIYDFWLDDHVPADHMLRGIDRSPDSSALRIELAPYYRAIGRPSIDPDLIVRTLVVSYCMGISSEWWFCEEVHLNLAYPWFCRLGLNG
jgi:transposase